MVRLPNRDTLIELASAILKTQVDPTKKFIAQGLDSLGAVELLEALHQRGLDVRPTRFSSVSSQEAAKYEPIVTVVMAGILGQETVPRTQDFFDLGGNSLKAMALALKLEKKDRRRAAF